MVKNPSLINMVGEKFGRWLVLKQAGNNTGVADDDGAIHNPLIPLWESCI